VSSTGKPTSDNAPGETASAADEMRPLPDGGLTGSMPEWLRRPPAWRDLPAKPDASASRELPEPDTSVIDPRTLIDVSDLPPWLHSIAARSSGVQIESNPSEAPVEPELDQAVVAGEAVEAAPETRKVPFVSQEPPASDHIPLAESVASPPWWQSSMAIAALAASLLIALVLIILLATGIL
jgi:hypothetical protein